MRAPFIPNILHMRLLVSMFYCIPWLSIIALLAFKLPTTAIQMIGLAAYEIVRNFEIASFCFSSAPETSAKAVSLVAGGPVGMSIMTNQRIGSGVSHEVLDATR